MGLGDRFLSVASQADALIHVADASGSIDAEGKLTRPGLGNPIMDIYDVEEEIILWFVKSIAKSVKGIRKKADSGEPLKKSLYRSLAGLKVRPEHIEKALENSSLEKKSVKKWSDKDLNLFAQEIRKLSKPTVIIANKMDIANASTNYERMIEEFKGSFVVPACSEAELALRRAETKGLIRYIPGEEKFQVLNKSELTKEQQWALNYVQERVLTRWVNTGVQFAKKMSDHAGKVLPDAFLIPYHADVRYLAKEIHTELEKTMLHAIDARTGLRLPTDYVLKDRDVISIIAAARKKRT
jgi:ribosome-binding ATPase YchF (GTP1/OBG family)